MKEFLYHKKKQIIAFSKLLLKKTQRIFVNKTITEAQSYNLPIIINNRNRYTYLLQLITWLEKNNYTNIIIIDNESTYTPLLEYYKTTKHKVLFLNKNMGYMALWQTTIFKKFKTNYYVYTDPDVLPNANCPADVVFALYKVLKQTPSIEKCGVALIIDDLPQHYKNKDAVIANEKKHWEHKISNTIYNAPVDTTFALYKPFAQGNAEDCKAYRLAGNYNFHHLPWYENSLQLSEEEKYYISNVKKGATMWSEKN